MAKIDEITEILITEIEDFNKSIDRLRELREEFTKIQVRYDPTPINNIFKQNIEALRECYHEQLVVLKKRSQEQHEILIAIQDEIKDTIILSKRLTLPFVIVISFIISNICFSFYQYQKIKETKKVAFEEGMDVMKEHLGEFFEADPSSYKKYETWQNKQ